MESRGRDTSTFRRLCSRAPRTMRWSITSHMLGGGYDSPDSRGWQGDLYDGGWVGSMTTEPVRWALAGYGPGGRTFHAPLILSAAEAADLVAHAERVGRTVVPYQNRRWDSDLLTIRRLLDEGALGRVHRFTSRFDRFRPVKSGWHGASVAEGGGVLLDLGPHLVDQATHLFGPVVAVHADLQTVRTGAGAEDQVELHLTHESGVRCTLAAGLASAAPGPRFQVNGDRAGFVIDGFDIQEQQLKAGHSPASLADGWGVEPESAWGRLYYGDLAAPVPSERGAWDSYYPAVARAVQGLDDPPVAARDAIATARVLDAARESAAERTVVLLRPDGAATRLGEDGRMTSDMQSAIEAL